MTGWIIAFALSSGQTAPDKMSDDLMARGMHDMMAYEFLSDLTTNIGPRLSGSPNAARAVEWGVTTMNRLGFQNVRKVPCMVPHWVRGDVEDCQMTAGGQTTPLTAIALGMSDGTAPEGVTAEVIEVHSRDEATKLGDNAKGKIVFFNGPFNQSFTSTFEAYGNAVGQRSGAAVVGPMGAVGVVVRSMTQDPDDTPHTGATRFVKGCPSMALGIQSAERLDAAIKASTADNPVKLTLKLSCKTLPDEPSASVVGEIVGSEHPEQVVIVGGHLDSWDKGRGAHDDGTGVCGSLDALRLIKELGWQPKRTIRVVLFMNEENGGRGARAIYDFEKASNEKVVAAIESDSGGFAPRSFGCSLRKPNAGLDALLTGLRKFEIDHFDYPGEGGADVGDLADLGAVVFGLVPESQRYFDYHHSDKDTIDKVNRRELQLGSMAMAYLAFKIANGAI